jgi:hypothetical protein
MAILRYMCMRNMRRELVVRVRRGTIYIMELIGDLLKGEGSDKRNVRRTKGPLYRRAQDKSGNSECRPSDPSPKGCEMSAV